jgi:hypothetical protein
MPNSYLCTAFLYSSWIAHVLQRNSHLYVFVGKQRNEKYVLSLSLELVNVGRYDFLHLYDW